MNQAIHLLLGALLLPNPLQRSLLLQPVPWNQNMMYLTSGGHYILWILSRDLLLCFSSFSYDLKFLNIFLLLNIIQI